MVYTLERLALRAVAPRAVAPRRAARRLRPPGTDNDPGRPLCAGGVVAARPLPPPNGRAIALSGCAQTSKSPKTVLPSSVVARLNLVPLCHHLSRPNGF